MCLNQEAMGPFGVLVEATHPGHDLRELPVPALRDVVRERRLLVLRGFAPLESADEMATWCARWGELMRWPSGAALDGVVLDGAESSHRGAVPLHWDGLYQSHIPEFQVFACIDAAETGGNTVFTDTAAVIADAEPEQVEQWAAVTVTYRVRGSGRARVPVVALHPVHGEPTIRFHEPARDGGVPDYRPEHEFDGVAPDDVPDFLERLRLALHDRKHHYRHTWQEGDVVVADNHALLHGREDGEPGERQLRRVYVLGTPAMENPYRTITVGARHGQ